MIGELLNDCPALASCELAAHPELVSNRCVALVVRGVPGVDCDLQCSATLGGMSRCAATSRSNFTLELFARGVASEDANKNAQPVVAAVMGDASWRCVSSVAPIALPSRPNHNAAAPCVKLISAFGLSTSSRPSRNCQVFGGLQARSGPSARQGRSKAEWLDWAEDRPTMSHRDGRTLERRRCSARMNRTNETRKVGKQLEVTATCRLRRRFGGRARSPI